MNNIIEQMVGYGCSTIAQNEKDDMELNDVFIRLYFEFEFRKCHTVKSDVILNNLG